MRHRSPRAEALELIIRPSPLHQPVMVLLYPPAVVLWIGCLLLVTHPHLLDAPQTSTPTPRLLVGLYIALVVIPIFVGIGLDSTRTAAIYLTATHIGYTGLSGKAVEYERTDLARIALLIERRQFHSGYGHTSMTIPTISFEARDGAELFRVTSRWWDLADLRRLAAACGVPIEGCREDISDR